MADEWLTITQAAELSPYSAKTLRDKAREGVIPASRLGRRGHFRIRRSVVEALFGFYKDERPPGMADAATTTASERRCEPD